MNNFKKGDWIKANGLISKISEINEKTFAIYTEQDEKFYPEECELWQPSIGEWCWFHKSIEDDNINEGQYVFAQFEGMRDKNIDLGYKKENTVVTVFISSKSVLFVDSGNGIDSTDLFLKIEPFISEKPTFL